MSLNIQTAAGLVKISGDITKEKVISALGYSPANEEIEPIVDGHINDANIHVTSNERELWTENVEGLISHTADLTTHVTSEEKTTWNNKSDFSGFYMDLLDAPNIQENESGEVIYADEMGNIIAKINKDGFETTAITAENAIINGMNIGVKLDEHNESVNDIKSDLTTHVSNVDIHITSDERDLWNNKSDFSGDYNDLINAPNITEDNSQSVIYADESGNIIARVDSNGLETTTVTAQNVVISGSDIKIELDEFKNEFDIHKDSSAIHITSNERMSWNAKADKSYIDSGLANKSDVTHSHDDKYDAKGSSDSALVSAKEYADSVANEKANAVKNDLLNGAGGAYDTLKELGDLIDVNVDAIEALEIVAYGKADANHTHDDRYYTETEMDTFLNGKANSNHNHDTAYDTKGAAADSLASAKSYTDTKTSGLASTSVVDNKITAHNTSTSAHNDIRALITDLSTKLNNFLDVDDTTTDQLSEVITLIENNKGTLESLTTSKINVSDIVNNLTTNSASKVLSAAQGVAIKTLIDALQDELDSHTHTVANITDLTATATELNKLDGVTVTTAELNYVGGVTSNIQTQLNGKAASSHEHDASNITSGVLSLSRVPTISVAKGGTGNTEGYVRAGKKEDTTIGSLATAEGRNTTSSGIYAHAEGNTTKATGIATHAEGQSTEASGDISHAEGDSTKAKGDYSHTEGHGTIASGESSHAQGRYNIEDTSDTYAHIVGNGTSNSARSNAHTLDWDGNAWFAGNVTVGADKKQLAVVDSGTWTPVFSNSSITFTQALYCKVGSLVYLTIMFSNTSTSNINAFAVSGLPFTIKNIANSNVGSVASVIQSSQTLPCFVVDSDNIGMYGQTSPNYPYSLTCMYLTDL